MSERHFSSREIHLGARLLAASTLVTGMLTLTGCDNTKTRAGLYRDPAECTAARIFTPEYCEANFKLAEAEHTKLAPHYATKKDCEKDWGKKECEDVDDQQAAHGSGTTVIYSGGAHANAYSPRMGGYWVGYSETPNSDQTKPPVQKRFSFPVYKSEDGGLYSPATDQSFSGYGASTENPDYATANSVETSSRPTFAKGSSFSEGSEGISRGGFGSTGRSFGFGVGE